MPKVSDEKLEARRQLILHSAIACFARNGFHETTMGDIAKQAGVSDGLAYRYFSSKDEIISEAIRVGMGQGRAAVEGAIEGDDPEPMLDLLWRSSFQRFAIPGRDTTIRLRLRSWAEAIDDEKVRERVTDRWHSHARIGEGLLKQAQEEGIVAHELDANAIARVMLAIHDGLDLQWSLDPGLDVEACRDVVMAMFQGRFWGDTHPGKAARGRGTSRRSVGDDFAGGDADSHSGEGAREGQTRRTTRRAHPHRA